MGDPYPSKTTLQPKYMGNVNICRKDLKRILMDKKAQAFYDEMVEAFRTNDFVRVNAEKSCNT